MTESGEGHKFSDGKVIVSDDKGVGLIQAFGEAGK